MASFVSEYNSGLKFTSTSTIDKTYTLRLDNDRIDMVEDYSMGLMEKLIATTDEDGNNVIKEDGYYFVHPHPTSRGSSSYIAELSHSGTFGYTNLFSTYDTKSLAYVQGRTSSLNVSYISSAFSTEHMSSVIGAYTNSTPNNVIVYGYDSSKTSYAMKCLVSNYNDTANMLIYNENVEDYIKLSINDEDGYVKAVTNTYDSGDYDMLNMLGVYNSALSGYGFYEACEPSSEPPNVGANSIPFYTVCSLEEITQRFGVGFHGNNGELRPSEPLLENTRSEDDYHGYKLEFFLVGEHNKYSKTETTKSLKDIDELNEIVQDILLSKAICKNYNYVTSIIKKAISKYNETVKTAYQITNKTLTNGQAFLCFKIIYDDEEYQNNIGIRHGGVFLDYVPVVLYKYSACPFPSSIEAGDTMLITPPKSYIKPMFLVNRNRFITFPCYSIWDRGESVFDDVDIIKTYDIANDVTTFNISLSGFIPNDLILSGSDCTITNTSTTKVYPNHFSYVHSSATHSEDYYYREVSSGNFTSTGYPVSLSADGSMLNGMTLCQSAVFNVDGVASEYDSSASGITLGSRYTMSEQQESAYFTIGKTFTVVASGSDIDLDVSFVSEVCNTTKLLNLSYISNNIQMWIETNDNDVDKTVIGDGLNYVLHKYMYDYTTIYVNTTLPDGTVLDLDYNNFVVSVSEIGGDVSEYTLTELVSSTFDKWIFTDGAVYDGNGIYHVDLIIVYKADGDYEESGFTDSNVTVSYKNSEADIETYRLSDGFVCVNYVTKLPPYIVQGIPFTKEPGKENVLNTESDTARVDYLHTTYTKNAEGWKDNYMFNNPEIVLYQVIASAFVPENANVEISGVRSYMYDDISNDEYPLNFVSASSIEDVPVMDIITLTKFGEANITETQYTSVNLITYTQDISPKVNTPTLDYFRNKVVIEGTIDYNYEASVVNTITIKSVN